MKTVFNFFKSINAKKVLLLLASPLVLFWQSMGEMVISLGMLIFLDLVMGIRANLKEKGVEFKLLSPSTWKNIESNGLKQTANKAKDYSFLIIGAFIMSHYMLKDVINVYGFGLDGLTALILGVIELWSMGENFRKLRGYNVFEYLFKLIKTKDIATTVSDIKDLEEK